MAIARWQGLADNARRTTDLIVQHSNSAWLAVLTLLVLVLEVQWGFWHSLDLPTIDEAWALTDGYRLAHSGSLEFFQWWNSSLYTLMYSASTLVFRSVEATFFGQRLILTGLSVVVLYFLLRRLLPAPLAWLGAGWWAVSTFLVDLNLDRTDWLAAATVSWLALIVAEPRSPKRMLAAIGLGIVTVLLRPDHLLFVAGLVTYWVIVLLYPKLPFTPVRKLLVIGVGLGLVGLVGLVVSVQLLRSSTTVGEYFMWVFANNRRGENPLLWVVFERDYGTDHSVMALVTHPAQFAKDVLTNLLVVFRFVKAMTTSTTWSPITVQVGRWLVAVLALMAIGGTLIGLQWEQYWSAFFKRYGAHWLLLLCLLPFGGVLLVLQPFPMYSLPFIPIVFGVTLLILWACVRPFIVAPQVLFVSVAAIILVLAPSPRDFNGPQPILHLVEFFNNSSDAGQAIAVTGDISTTVCAYVALSGKGCKVGWPTGEAYETLGQKIDTLHPDYLIYDDTMRYVLSGQPDSADWVRLIAGQDPAWQEVYAVDQYRVYKHVGGFGLAAPEYGPASIIRNEGLYQ